MRPMGVVAPVLLWASSPHPTRRAPDAQPSPPELPRGCRSTTRAALSEDEGLLEHRLSCQAARSPSTAEGWSRSALHPAPLEPAAPLGEHRASQTPHRAVPILPYAPCDTDTHEVLE